MWSWACAPAPPLSDPAAAWVSLIAQNCTGPSAAPPYWPWITRCLVGSFSFLTFRGELGLGVESITGFPRHKLARSTHAFSARVLPGHDRLQRSNNSRGRSSSISIANSLLLYLPHGF